MFDWRAKAPPYLAQRVVWRIDTGPGGFTPVTRISLCVMRDLNGLALCSLCTLWFNHVFAVFVFNIRIRRAEASPYRKRRDLGCSDLCCLCQLL